MEHTQQIQSSQPSYANDQVVQEKEASPESLSPKKRVTDDTLAIVIGSLFVIATILIYLISNGTFYAVEFSSWENISELFSNLFSLDFILPYLGTWLILSLVFSVGNYWQSEAPIGRSILAFTGLYLLASLAYIISSQLVMKQYLEYAFWALIVGLIVSNVFGVPDWLKPALRSDYLVKIGLILMGTEIIFSNITKFGIYGIAIVLLVVPATMYFMWFFGTKVLKMKDEKLVMVLATATSVCGVSAAVASASAIKASKEDLSYTVSITIMFTVVMMVGMPFLVDWLGLSELVGGAWIGNTVDSTGAVVLAGEALGPIGSQAAALIKMIQNLLIGVVVVVLAVYFASKETGSKETVSYSDIWGRLPKFILGFIAMSIIFSFIVQPIFGAETTNLFIDSLGSWKGWFFCLTFLAIGLETNFKEMIQNVEGGKPVSLYVSGQLFSVVLSLIVCYLLLSGVLFPVPDLATFGG